MRGRIRRVPVLLGLLVFALMGLIPPWQYTFTPEGAATATKPAGYHLLFEPPEPERRHALAGVRIDVSRLAIQWAILAAIIGVFLTRRDRNQAGSG